MAFHVDEQAPLPCAPCRRAPLGHRHRQSGQQHDVDAAMEHRRHPRQQRRGHRRRQRQRQLPRRRPPCRARIERPRPRGGRRAQHRPPETELLDPLRRARLLGKRAPTAATTCPPAAAPAPRRAPPRPRRRQIRHQDPPRHPVDHQMMDASAAAVPAPAPPHRARPPAPSRPPRRKPQLGRSPPPHARPAARTSVEAGYIDPSQAARAATAPGGATSSCRASPPSPRAARKPQSHRDDRAPPAARRAVLLPQARRHLQHHRLVEPVDGPPRSTSQRMIGVAGSGPAGSSGSRVGAAPAGIGRRRQRRDRLMLEHRPRRDHHAPPAAPGHQLDRHDAIAAEREEVVVDADPLDARAPGRTAPPGPPRAACAAPTPLGRRQLRRRQRPPVQLAVRRQRQTLRAPRPPPAPCTPAAVAADSARSAAGIHAPGPPPPPHRRPAAGCPAGPRRTTTAACATPACAASTASISPGSIRNPRILTWSSARPRNSSTPSGRHRTRSPVRYIRCPAAPNGSATNRSAVSPGPTQIAPRQPAPRDVQLARHPHRHRLQPPVQHEHPRVRRADDRSAPSPRPGPPTSPRSPTSTVASVGPYSVAASRRPGGSTADHRRRRPPRRRTATTAATPNVRSPAPCAEQRRRQKRMRRCCCSRDQLRRSVRHRRVVLRRDDHHASRPPRARRRARAPPHRNSARPACNTIARRRCSTSLATRAARFTTPAVRDHHTLGAGRPGGVDHVGDDSADRAAARPAPDAAAARSLRPVGRPGTRTRCDAGRPSSRPRSRRLRHQHRRRRPPA